MAKEAPSAATLLPASPGGEGRELSRACWWISAWVWGRQMQSCCGGQQDSVRGAAMALEGSCAAMRLLSTAP